MKNNKISFAIGVVLFFAAVPAFGNGMCSTCPNGGKGKTMPAIQPIERLLPGSVTSLNEGPDAIVLNPDFGSMYLHPAEMLIGRVPGVRVTGGYNYYTIRIRGAMGPPLLVIDNMPFYNYDDEALNNLLWSIPTADIERIEVLKNAAEASVYAQAGNGVIRVITRRGGEEDAE